MKAAQKKLRLLLEGYLDKDQKEDKRDSRKIARSLRGGELAAIYVPSEKTLEDCALVRTRKMLTKGLTRYKNRIKA